MRITVHAYHEMGHLAAVLPEDGCLDLPPGATVAQALACLGLERPPPSGLILFRNGRPADRHTRLEAGDRLTIMAPLSGG